MSGKPGDAVDEPGATFVRPPEERTQELLSSPSPGSTGEADPDLPRLRPQELLAGRFSIVRFIARGGMGAVYEAEDLSLRTRVALKIIRSALLANSSALERFRREVLLARRVGHPNVCHVYEFYDARTADGVAVHFLTMELLEGGTLAHHLRDRGRMSTAEALPLVLQMCDGLSAAHAEGVVHRDFKSSNVLLVQRRGGSAESGSTRAVITDFGIARPIETGGEGDSGLTGGAGNDRHAGVHGAGAGHRRRHHPEHRRLRAGGGDVRDGDGRAALHRGNAAGRRREAYPGGGAGTAHRAPRPGPALERDHRPLSRPRTGSALRQRGRGACRPPRAGQASGAARGARRGRGAGARRGRAPRLALSFAGRRGCAGRATWRSRSSSSWSS